MIEPKGVYVEPVGNLKWDVNGESSVSLSEGQRLGENIILTVTHSDYRPFQIVEVGESPGSCENENGFECETINTTKTNRYCVYNFLFIILFC